MEIFISQDKMQTMCQLMDSNIFIIKLRIIEILYHQMEEMEALINKGYRIKFLINKSYLLVPVLILNKATIDNSYSYP